MAPVGFRTVCVWGKELTIGLQLLHPWALEGRWIELDQVFESPLASQSCSATQTRLVECWQPGRLNL
jgi:hypothetical protein